MLYVNLPSLPEDIPASPLDARLSPLSTNPAELSTHLLNFSDEEAGNPEEEEVYSDDTHFTPPQIFNSNMGQENYYYPPDYRDWWLAQTSMERDQWIQAFTQLQGSHTALSALVNNLFLENSGLRRYNFEEYFGKQRDELRKMGISERALGEKSPSQ